ncbi:MAG: oligosaccharide flippase family protein [Candidatus Marsarchaeota archaeon]|nr:oligosaccharide flippase family protein [Candidatus Marsarchaeota archaeon]
MDDVGEVSETRQLGSKALKSGSFFVSSKAISAVITLLLLVFLARYLQPVEYGIYTIVVAFYTLLGMGGNFGMGTALRKKLSESNVSNERKRELVSNGFAIAGLVALVITIFGVAISGFLVNYVYHDPSMFYPIVVASVCVILSVLFNLSVAVLLGLGSARHSSLGNIVYAISQAIFVIALVLLGYRVLGAMMGLALSLLIGFIYSIIRIFKITGNFFPKLIRGISKELAGFSIPIVTSNVAINGTTSLAILLLGVFATTAVVGSYGAAYKLGRFFDLIMTSMSYVLLPAFSYTLTKESLKGRLSSIYGNSLYYAFIVLLPLLAYAISTSKPLVRLLFGKAYVGAPFYFSFVSIGIVISLIGIFTGILIIGNGDVKKFMKYQLTVVVVEVALLLLLVPYAKVFGALIAVFAVGPVVMDVLYIKALKEQFGIKVESKRLGRLALSSVMLFIVLYAATMSMHYSRLAVLANIIIAVLLYPPMLAVTRSIGKNNIEFIKESMSKVRQLRKISSIAIGYFELFM